MKSSTLVGILVSFAGYTVASYGYVLIRGWNIPLRAWVSPLNPYLWPGGDPGPVPPGQIFPSQANAAAAASLGQLGSNLAAGARAAASPSALQTIQNNPGVFQVNPAQQAAEGSAGNAGQLANTIAGIIAKLTHPNG